MIHLVALKGIHTTQYVLCKRASIVDKATYGRLDVYNINRPYIVF